MIRLIFAGSLVLASVSALAANYLSGTEVQSLFEGAVAIEPKGQQGVGGKFSEWNFNKGGKLVKYSAGGKKSRSGMQEGTWSVDGKGRLCFSLMDEKQKCRFVREDGGKVKLFNKKGKEKTVFSEVRGG